ncbi:LamG domain-containing protein [Sulfurimonas sp.]|uniref:LamG domain-containing protein n=1 Tax=Sulfurimonas sp. TaxID=2022749 RepID=UPI002B465689|nr:LamG domain-containing protein [Sulfurimonas sp.]
MKTFNTKFSFLLLIFLFFTSLSAFELSNDTFDNSTNGYTGTGVSATSGWLLITRDNTASKTYDFGVSYANLTVTFNIKYRTSGGWEDSGGSQDSFDISVNGSQIQSYSVLDGTYIRSFTANTDANGRILLTLNPDTTDNNEQIELDYLQITASILKAEYRFDECSYKSFTNEVIDSVGTSHGQSYNGVSTDSNSTICSSASFDGNDDYISMGNSFNNIFGRSNNRFTITGWIMPKGFDPATSSHGTANTIFAKASQTRNDNLEIGVNSDGSLHVYIDAITDFTGNIGSGITQDNWHFIAVIYDGATLTTFIDGVKSTNTTPTGRLANARRTPFTIGTTLNNGTSFNGLIDEVKIFSIALSDSAIATIYANEKAKNEYLGTSRTCTACIPSFCKLNSLTEGFHIVDPDGGDDSNSYEIYCDINSPRAPRELIALPLKNNYNNFVFEDDSPSANYYKQADKSRRKEAANSFNFLQISISGSTVKVVPNSLAEGSSNNQGHFSNINLIGTPFSIDWTNTSLSNCDPNKLRIGAWNQAVKINTLDYTNGRCKVEQMQLKLLDTYKYLTYPAIKGTTNGSTTGDYNTEILEETCREIFQKVPDAPLYLPTLGGASNGYFWIDPDKGGRVKGDTITTKFRPFVAYCKYQEIIKQAWTFVMALDAKVTNSKDDIKTMTQVRANPNVYHDTCSQLGLLFFVPNTKDTFQRTKAYLFENKSEWINYTGTIREKYKIYTNKPSKEYYITPEGYNEVWPYGPFGLYFPQNGNHAADGKHTSWQNNMQGRCMNSGTSSGASTCTDYTKNAVPLDDWTMGIMGWRTTLQDMIANNPSDPTLSAISNGDQWWIADVGAGNYLTKSSTVEYSVTAPGIGGGGASVKRDVYYEPNGNYKQDAWLNFISDSNGNVYHNDDNNAFYSYYDYLCMSWDNYLGVSRYGATDGPFTVIKHLSSLTVNKNTNYPINAPTDLNITTKIFKEKEDFDILLLSKDRTLIVNDQNINAGVFLVKVEDDGLKRETTDLHYYGYIGNISSWNQDPKTEYFDLKQNKRGVIKLTDALSSVNNVHKVVSFQFKYCALAASDWTKCWDVSGIGINRKATCGAKYDSKGKPKGQCRVADSNEFSIRPKNFSLSSVDGVPSGGKLIVKAQDTNISYLANDFNDNPASDYNTSFNDLDTSITLILGNKNCSTVDLRDINKSAYAFADGMDSHTYTLSDVGEYKFTIKENRDKEFAIVDKNDTLDIDRFISPNTVNLLIKPHHFKITTPPSKINHNSATGFTYLSNDLEKMGASLIFTAEAQNQDNNITKNYSKECYASDVNISIAYTLSRGNSNISSPTGDIIFKDFNTTTTTPLMIKKPLSDLNITLLIPPTEAFTSDHNGSGNFGIKFNFERKNNEARNPFIISINDLNVSDQTTVLKIGTDGSHIIKDVNATMFYGRAQGPKRAITKICYAKPCFTKSQPDANNPRLIYQVYSDNSAFVPAFDNKGTGDTRWFANSWHREGNNDGIIGAISQKGASSVSNNDTPKRSTDVFNFEYYLKYSGTTYPYTATMENNATNWLIYDELNENATHNKFEVEFRKDGAWNGKAENSTTTKTKAKGITNRRTMW